MAAGWPEDTMRAKVAFYGDPRGAHGFDKAWATKNLTQVKPPFKMTFAGKPIKTITFHKKCADALSAALDDIWVGCGKSQAQADKLGLSEYGVAFNYRLIRGSSDLSNHSFAIAIDLAPSGNPLGAKKGTMPKFAVDAFKAQGARWGGDYKGRKDLMHFEFVSPA